MSWYSLSVNPIEEYTSAVIAGIGRSISAAVATFLVLGVLGCGSTSKFQGTWKGNRNLPISNGENPGLIRTLGQVTLSIDSGRFNLTETGIPYSGTVRYADDKAYLKVETRFGTPISKEPIEIQNQLKEYVLTPLKNGQLSYVDPGGNFREPLTLERQVDAPKKGT
jgi:hypothetical protein